MQTYVDGKFSLFHIEEDNKYFSQEILIDDKLDIWFSELSVGDRLKIEMQQSGIEITTKIRIPQYKKITSKSVCIIDGKDYKVFNAYHFTDDDGIKQSDLTLTRYQQWTELI